MAQDSDTSGYFPQLARWHDRERYQMIFATLNPMAPWLQDYMAGQGVECFSCACQSRRDYVHGIERLRRFLRRRRVDILHAHLFEPAIVSLTAGFLARTPLRVLTRHYSDYHTRDNKKWHVQLDKYCTALSHRVIAVSKHTAEGMIADEGAPPQKIVTILNGVDFDRLKISSPDAPQKLRDEFAPQDEFLILQVSRLHPEKGHEFLFRALPLIKQQWKRPIRLLLAGAGPFEAQYRRLVEELGLQEMVSFLGFRRDISDLMQAADVMVLPSVAEAFGLVLTEALYLGTPVIASRVGGIPEIISDGVDGFLVPPASPSELARAIIQLARDEELRAKLASAGREKVEHGFSFENMARSYENVYSQLLHS